MSADSNTVSDTGRVFAHDVCVVGGAGHVGAPFSIVCASRGLKTVIYDTNQHSLEALKSGRLPFLEAGAEELLQSTIRKGTLHLSDDISIVGTARYVVVTIGTPVDEFHNPVLRIVRECIDELLPHINDSQTLILRSTVSPGVTEYLESYLKKKRKPCARLLLS